MATLSEKTALCEVSFKDWNRSCCNPGISTRNDQVSFWQTNKKPNSRANSQKWGTFLHSGCFPCAKTGGIHKKDSFFSQITDFVHSSCFLTPRNQIMPAGQSAALWFSLPERLRQRASEDITREKIVCVTRMTLAVLLQVMPLDHGEALEKCNFLPARCFGCFPTLCCFLHGREDSGEVGLHFQWLG